MNEIEKIVAYVGYMVTASDFPSFAVFSSQALAAEFLLGLSKVKNKDIFEFEGKLYQLPTFLKYDIPNMYIEKELFPTDRDIHTSIGSFVEKELIPYKVPKVWGS